MKKCPFNFYGETKRSKLYLNNFKVSFFILSLEKKPQKEIMKKMIENIIKTCMEIKNRQNIEILFEKKRINKLKREKDKPMSFT